MSAGTEHITLAHATRICDGAVAACLSHGFAPVTVHVCNEHGEPIAFQRMDGCNGLLTPDVARCKAYTAVSLRMSSRAFREKYTTGNESAKYGQMLSMVSISGGNLAPFPGGIVVKSNSGVLIGGVGVSGAAGDEDEFCALQAVKEAGFGFFTEPAEHSLKLGQKRSREEQDAK
eukprot:CAMPEP_0177319154 /NCGR_PEP_ID=MMETSP0368-20130122/14455_1 /TAXON_ID=447022 ORGANISM="Scrippsiella hangoei-like, Strain SHHI-4" /NCGR_SAMPLE_ID=MMETSP0368 /ASSEMBLY_ACC=CAM_ASM_000363 /LENGTH=173 /DNA_ID=CAMNT_0018778629 /DNA_START=6 /DNA_END=527 /DNA_ORIENTATION=+